MLNISMEHSINDSDEDLKSRLTHQIDDHKGKKMNSGIVCYILIPLILSIIATTGLSITVLTVISPYWSKIGSQSLIQDHISTLTSLCTVMGNSMQEILQKHSNIRSQILLYYYRNVYQQDQNQEMRARAQKSKQQNTVNLNKAYDYNDSTLIGWGIVDGFGNLSKIDQINDLNNQQSQDLLWYGSTLPLLQVWKSTAQNFTNFVYFHSISEMFVCYPLKVEKNYQNSPLVQMQQDYMKNSQSVVLSVLVDLNNGTLQICDAIISSDQQFQGILCLGMLISTLQTTFQFLGSELNYAVDMFTVMTNIPLSTISSSTNELYSVNQEGVKTHQYPSILSLLFPPVNGVKNLMDQKNFMSTFGQLLDRVPSCILYTGSYMKAGSKSQAIMREVYTNEIGVLGQVEEFDVQLITLIIELEVNTFINEFSYLADAQQFNTLSQILILCVPIGTIMCITAWVIAIWIIRGMQLPLQDLHYKLVLLCEDTLNISVYSNFRESSQDINQLYEALHRLITVLNFANPKYFEGDEADLLIKYSEGLMLFEQIKSARGLGLNLNNIANIHRSNKRYAEAIKYYKESIFLCEQDILELTGLKKMEQLYPILKINKCTSIEQQKNSQENFINQRRQTTIERVVTPAIFISSLTDVEENKSNLEELHSNRNFSLSTTLIESARIANLMDKELLYQESIDRLEFIIFLDDKSKKNLHRQIISRTLLCESYLEIKDIDEAKKQIKMAEILLDEYEQVYEMAISQNTLNVNPGILRKVDKVFKVLGVLCLRYHNTKTAAKIFTDCLQTSKYYDPEIRLNCLQYLNDIMKNQDLLQKTPNIPKLLQLSQKKKNKDIVFVMDFSESMQNKKKDFAIEGILKIFDNYLQNQDRIAFMRYNQVLNVVFELTQKDENPKFLRNAIEHSSNETAKGESALLQAIIYGQKLLLKAIEKDHEKWIVVITDGDDNISKISFRKMERLLQAQSDISLIIIGVALPDDCKNDLNELCRMTRNGLFIESVDSEDLDIAFQALTYLVNRNFLMEKSVELLTI